MYSYEDRILAVKLYIKLGKRTGATIQQLGYPTKNALKSWYREFEQCCDLPVSYVRSKPKYSDEQKKVPLSATSARSVSVKPSFERVFQRKSNSLM